MVIIYIIYVKREAYAIRNTYIFLTMIGQLYFDVNKFMMVFMFIRSD